MLIVKLEIAPPFALLLRRAFTEVVKGLQRLRLTSLESTSSQLWMVLALLGLIQPPTVCPFVSSWTVSSKLPQSHQRQTSVPRRGHLQFTGRRTPFVVRYIGKGRAANGRKRCSTSLHAGHDESARCKSALTGDSTHQQR